MAEQRINHVELERYCSDLDLDCLPRNVRQWNIFHRQYNAMYDFFYNWHDPTFWGITVDDVVRLREEHLFLGHGFKYSPSELVVDLSKMTHRFDIFDNLIALGLNFSVMVDTWYFFERMINCTIIQEVDSTHYVRNGRSSIPRHIAGTYSCNKMKMDDLVGGPVYVGGDYKCEHTGIISLKGVAEYIGGDLLAMHNRLRDLEHSPKYVNLIDVRYNEIINLKLDLGIRLTKIVYTGNAIKKIKVGRINRTRKPRMLRIGFVELAIRNLIWHTRNLRIKIKKWF